MSARPPAPAGRDAAPGLSERPQWRRLHQHCRSVGQQHLRALFAADPSRGEQLAAEAAGLYLDYSKQRVTRETLRLLTELAVACGLPVRIEAMFRGEPINATEGRAALHVALRAPAGECLFVGGRDVVPDVHAVLDRMAAFCAGIRDGTRTGFGGKRIRNIVNIGIGGSDLGPVMAYEALRHYSLRDLEFRFVSNVDGTDLTEALRLLDPAETLFVVCSKSFTTQETLTNALAARAWCLGALGDEQAIARHFVAVSTNAAGVTRSGSTPGTCSSSGTGSAGATRWTRRSGCRPCSRSARTTSAPCSAGSTRWTRTSAVLRSSGTCRCCWGCTRIWNSNFLGAQTVAALPYEQYLKRLPAYLQQLTMESNGKHVTLDGAPVDYPTGPIYWGEPGTNGQHSFYQLIHQGTPLIACDFIGFGQSLNPVGGQHDLLVANMLAQSEALAFGKTAEEAAAEGMPEALVPHRTFEGNRPSNTILADRLTPASLGALVALYEHSVFVRA